jgi:hypothetical protein
VTEEGKLGTNMSLRTMIIYSIRSICADSSGEGSLEVSGRR